MRLLRYAPNKINDFACLRVEIAAVAALLRNDIAAAFCLACLLLGC